MEQINDIISDDNTYIGKLVHYWDTRGLPKKKINIILKDGITMVAYIPVSHLPTPGQAEEGVFYITPDDVIHYIRNGGWHSIEPDGEDNVIEIIRDSDGNALPVASDKSVTLPVDQNTTYTFEEVYVNSKLVGWRVRNNDTSEIVFTHTDVDDKSDGTYFTSNTLNKRITQTTSVPLNTITGIIADDIVLNETLIYDTYGTVGIVIEKTTTNVTVKTITTNDRNDDTRYTSASLDPEIGSETTITSATLVPTPESGDIIVNRTLIWDAKGTVGVVSAVMGNAVHVKTITNTADYQSDGTYKTIARLNPVVDSIDNLPVSLVPEIEDFEACVPRETLVYDNYGTVARVISINAEDRELEIQTITAIDWVAKVWYSTTTLNTEVHQTTSVDLLDLTLLSDKTTHPVDDDILINKTFITDASGTIGVIIDYDQYDYGDVIVETITTDKSPFVLFTDDMLSIQEDGSQAVQVRDLKDYNGNTIAEFNIQLGKSLVFDSSRGVIGLVTGLSNHVAVVDTIYSVLSSGPETLYVVKQSSTTGLPLFEFPELNETKTLQSDFLQSYCQTVDGSHSLLVAYQEVDKTYIYDPYTNKVAVISAKSGNFTTVKTVLDCNSNIVYHLRDTGAGHMYLEPYESIGTNWDFDYTNLYTPDGTQLQHPADINKMVLYKTLIYDDYGQLGLVVGKTAYPTRFKVQTLSTNYSRTIIHKTTEKLPIQIGAEAKIPYTSLYPTMEYEEVRNWLFGYTWLFVDPYGTTAVYLINSSSDYETNLLVKTVSTSDCILTKYVTETGYPDIHFSATVGDTTQTIDRYPRRFGVNDTVVLTIDDLTAKAIICQDIDGNWAQLQSFEEDDYGEVTMTWETVVGVPSVKVLYTGDLAPTVGNTVSLDSSNIWYANRRDSGPSIAGDERILREEQTLCSDYVGRLAVYVGTEVVSGVTKYKFKTIVAGGGGGKYYILKNNTGSGAQPLFSITPETTTTALNSYIIDPITDTAVDVDTLTAGEIIYDTAGTQAYWVGLATGSTTESTFKTVYNSHHNLAYYWPSDITNNLSTGIGDTTLINSSDVCNLDTSHTQLNSIYLRPNYTLIIDRWTGTVGIYAGLDVTNKLRVITLWRDLNTSDHSAYYISPSNVFSRMRGDWGEAISNNSILDKEGTTVSDVANTLAYGDIIIDGYGTFAKWLGVDSSNPGSSRIQTVGDNYNIFYYKPDDVTQHLNSTVGGLSAVRLGDIRDFFPSYSAISANNLIARGLTLLVDFNTGTMAVYTGNHLPTGYEFRTIITGQPEIEIDSITLPEIYDIWYGEESS